MLTARPMTDTPADSGSSATVRRSYTLEFKLKAMEWYETNGKKISATARQLKVAPKRIREWRSLKENIQNQAGGCRSKDRERSFFFPFTE